MAELSVVVTVYRVEPYLKKCISSILNQGFRNLELILVDDGSPDGCPVICDAYAKCDPRVQVIHQENQGSVKARRAGLLAASGDYVSFVDGDDWLEGEMYVPMMALARLHDADMVVSGYLQGTEDAFTARQNAIRSGVYRGNTLQTLRDRALFTGEYYEPGIVPALWNKLIRRELLLSLGDLVHREVKMGDDAAVTYPLILSASCIVVQNEIRAYHYRETEGSLSRGYDEKYFDRLYYLIEGLQERLKAEPSMYCQLPYYMLFLLETGFGQMIAARRPLPAVCKVIGEQIERFALPLRLRDIDANIVGKRVMTRVRLLEKNRPGGYLLLKTWEMILAKIGFK